MTRGTCLPTVGRLAALASLILLAGCEDLHVSTVQVESLEVVPDEGEILPGDSLLLTAVARDRTGNVLPDRQIIWTSDDDGIATVSAEGMVRAHAVGSAVIRATFDGAQGTAAIDVAEPPRIAVGQPRVRFLGTAGETSPSPVSIDVTGEGAWPLSGLSVAVSHPDGEPDGWLAADLGADTAPTTLLLTPTTQALAFGTYRADVEIVSPVAGNSPRLLEVELELAAPPPWIQLQWSALGFVWEEGQSVPPPQSVRIENAGGGELTGLDAAVEYDDGTPTGWLDVSLASTTAPTDLLVQVDPEGLGTGVYEAHVTLSSPGAANSPQLLPVRLTVGDPPPMIGLDPQSIDFTVTRGDSPPVARSVTVENQGSGSVTGLEASVSYDAGGPTGWLRTELESTTTPTTLDLAITDTDLEPGTHGATVLVQSPDAVNSPQEVAVGLTVTRPWSQDHSAIHADPDTLTADGASTSTITVELRDEEGALLGSGGHTIELEATAEATLGSVSDHGNGRYTASLTAPVVTGIATVSARVNGVNLQKQATVTFVPGPASPATSTITADPDSIRADGSATSEITVRLRDVHGNPLIQGGDNVILHHSGSGSLGPVSDRGDGTYTATLTASLLPGSATITGDVNGEEIEDSATVWFTPLLSATAAHTEESTGGRKEPPVSPALARTLHLDFRPPGPYIPEGATDETNPVGSQPTSTQRSGTETE